MYYTNYNKGRVSAQLGDGWKQHARIVPLGITPIGLVTRKELTQSLGVDANGDYWAFGTGSPELLPRFKVQSAIAAHESGVVPLSQADRMALKSKPD